MPSHEVLVDFWCSHLKQRGFTEGERCCSSGRAAPHRRSFSLPDPIYERKVARCLAKNELTRPKQLKVAEHPKEWLGAFEFSDAELDAIKGLCNVPAHLLRYALIAGMLIGSCIAMASGWVLMNGRRSFH